MLKELFRTKFKRLERCALPLLCIAILLAAAACMMQSFFELPARGAANALRSTLGIAATLLLLALPVIVLSDFAWALLSKKARYIRRITEDPGVYIGADLLATEFWSLETLGGVFIVVLLLDGSELWQFLAEGGVWTQLKTVAAQGLWAPYLLLGVEFFLLFLVMPALLILLSVFLSCAGANILKRRSPLIVFLPAAVGLIPAIPGLLAFVRPGIGHFPAAFAAWLSASAPSVALNAMAGVGAALLLLSAGLGVGLFFASCALLRKISAEDMK